MLINSIFAAILLYLSETQAIICHQCSGWTGKYPLSQASISSCDNLNNYCESPEFCVRIIDPIAPDVPYETFKSDCYMQNTLQLTPQNITYIGDSECFPYRDNNNPPKRWTYCFCNDHDYCNIVRPIVVPENRASKQKIVMYTVSVSLFIIMKMFFFV